MPKSVDTLVSDIYGLFDGHTCDPGLLQEFGQQLAATVGDRLAAYGETREGTLRMSNLGRGDRQLWYEIKGGEGKEQLQPHTKIKFLYGDILECLLLFLAKEAGHEVTDEQAEVDVNGIKGHIDAVIDGVVVDVKSASTHAFKKFRDGKLGDDDPFGYVEQISGYSAGTGGRDGAFLAIDKQNGHIALDRHSKEELAVHDIEGRIEHLKEVMAGDEMPDRCYEPVEEGTSGNLVLGLNCSYCPFKEKCWADANGGIGLRTYLYSTGPKNFVHVAKEPRVQEITF